MDPSETILFEKLRREKKLTATLIDEFQERYKDLFFKAIEYIHSDNCKVVKNIFIPSNTVVWTVQGLDQNYIVYPDLYCQCQSFLMDAIYRNRKFKVCKHLLAQKIAEILNLFEIQQRIDI